jgi:predicted nucleic acid-binding protein
MMCVDASVAAKWVLPEEYSPAALTLLDEALARRERIIAPHLIRAEFTNILRQRMRHHGLSLAGAHDTVAAFLDIPVILSPSSSDQARALQASVIDLAARYDLPAAYDANYLALALLRDCPLWTNDRRLIRRVDDGAIDIRWIGDYPLPPVS